MAVILNIESRTRCSECKTNLATKLRTRRSGSAHYSTKCASCRKKKKKFALKEGKVCAHCGFTAVHRCQMDIDHIDGNHRNNDPANLQVLCANCHRLKTLLNSDWTNKTHAA